MSPESRAKYHHAKKILGAEASHDEIKFVMKTLEDYLEYKKRELDTCYDIET
jgi:hypothetical protein